MSIHYATWNTEQQPVTACGSPANEASVSRDWTEVTCRACIHPATPGDRLRASIATPLDRLLVWGGIMRGNR